MSNNLLRTLLFVLVMMAYLFFPYFSISSYQKVLTDGNIYRFRPEPIDPYDAFRGKYVRLRFPRNQLTISKIESFSKGDQIYLTLRKDSLGFTHFANGYKSPPEHTSDYIQSRVTQFYDSTVYFKIPFDRYYLNEKLAPIAEQKYGELVRRSQDSTFVYLDVRVKKGKAIIDELYFEDLPVIEYLNSIPTNHTID